MTRCADPTLDEAGWQTVTENLGLVHWMLRKMRVHDDRWDDAYQDGVIGLAIAVERWDPAKGALSTYAQHWIRQRVERGRGELEGVNYRRAYINHGKASYGTTYDAPLSLDRPLGDPDGWGLLDVTPADDNPESDALTAVLAGQVERAMYAACRDHLDTMAWRHLIGTDDRPLAHMAREVGVSATTLNYRVQRLQHIALDALGEAA
jgi:RNA polymerase sigma factor (sigma-70 family)